MEESQKEKLYVIHSTCSDRLGGNLIIYQVSTSYNED